jgi:hypothetical protein
LPFGSEMPPDDEIMGARLNVARELEYSHDDKHCADHHTLCATAKDGVRDDRQGLVHDHVGKEEGDEEQMTILANRFNLVRVLTLLTECLFKREER